MVNPPNGRVSFLSSPLVTLLPMKSRSPLPSRILPGGPGAGLSSTGLFLLLPALALAPLCCHAGAASLQVVFGARIPLAGTAPGSDYVYLFLTGPNLPARGISLVGGFPVVTGVPGSFTRVDVLTDGTWSLTWDTRSLGRVLDPGTYVIYIVEEPRSLPDLDDAAYATQSVTFGAPVETVTVAIAETTGSLAVDSSPGMSDVTLDGRPVGITPLVLSGIPAGSHTLVISRQGYADYRTNFTVLAGERREINASLEPVTPAPLPVSTPPTATPPGRLAPPTLVPLAAAALAILGFRKRS